MSGPPNWGDNRFSLLADGPRSKKKRSNQNILEVFPELPLIQKPDPKYIVISATGDKTLQQYSCFSVHRSLKLICSDILSVSELRDGNLLLLIGNKPAADKLIATKTLPGVCNIQCAYHPNLNFSKGTIYAPYLNNVPDSEIVEELKSQGVVEIYKYQKKNVEGKLSPCGVVLLTFDRYSTPEKMDISWHKVKVRQYIPNPMRCKSCQLLGHTKKWCKNSPLCENCALPPHTPEECTRIFCVNCSEDHPSSSRDCKKFKQQKEILKIKTIEKCSLKVAKEKYQHTTSTPPLVLSFADITNKNNNKTLNKNTTEEINNSLDKNNLNLPSTSSQSNKQQTEKPKNTSDNSKVTINKNTEVQKIQKTSTKNNNIKATSTIITRSTAKALANKSATTINNKNSTSTLNLTQNQNLAMPEFTATTSNNSFNEQEDIMFVDNE